MVDSEGGQKRRWIFLFLISLVVLLLGVLCCILLFPYVVTEQSPVKDDITLQADTLAALRVPRTLAPMVTQPTKKPSPLPWNISTTMPPIPKHFVPSSHLEGDKCVGQLCRYVANMLRYKIAFYIDPCIDFYQYVCGKFRGWSTFKDVQISIKIGEIVGLAAVKAPSSHQSPIQKAAAMYQACVSFATSHEQETTDLVKWMEAMDLDFLNTTRLESIDPVDMMVRGSLDFGVEAIISITPQDREFGFLTHKRIIERINKGRRVLEHDYSELFLKYGVQQSQASLLAEKVYAYEEILRSIEKSTVNWHQWKDIHIDQLGEYTYPHVTGEQWAALLSKYTDGIYKWDDITRLFQHSLSIIKKLFEDKRAGKVGMQYLVAWSIYRQLVNFTDPDLFRGDREADEYCFEHVKKVMRLAILSHYFQSLVPPSTIKAATSMAYRIKSALRTALQSSRWLTESVRKSFMNKWSSIRFEIGSAGNRLNPEFVEKFYAPLPDVPLNRLFPSWIQAHRLNTHYRWKDQETRFFDEEAVRASYEEDKEIVIPVGLLQRPFFYEYGPEALNYGALGTVIGHQLMHAYDPAHLEVDFWHNEELKKEYTKRALCLRRSHRSILSLSGLQQVLNDTVDSENIADFVGTKLAYAAYAFSGEEVQRVKLANLNLTAEKLFFVDCAEGQKRRWIFLFLTSLIVLLLGVLCCILLFPYLVTEQSPVKDDITADTLAALHVPTTLARVVTRPSKKPSPLPWNISTTTTLIPKHFVPSSHLEGNECVGLLCRYVANMLRSKIATYIDPCVDFYQYVCGAFRGWSTFKDTIDLVRWMTAMNLDFLNTTILESIDPVDMMVRGSLDLGVEAIISFTPKDREFGFSTYKRIIEINYSKEQETWIMQRIYKGSRNLEYEYSQLFLKYGVQQSQASVLAEKVYAYEEILRSIEKSTVNWNQSERVLIGHLGVYTYPHVTGEPLPDAPLNRLFPSWIQAHRLNTHYRWKDQITRFFDEEAVRASYEEDETIVIPVGILQPPFFYEYGPEALNYGSLGTVIGHQLMHAYDPAHLGEDFWHNENVKKEYTKRALCLRRSHRSIASQDPLLTRCRLPQVDSAEGQKRCWIFLFLTSLIVLLLGVLCCILLLPYLVTEQSPVKDDITADTLAALHVPTTLARVVTRPSKKPSPLPWNISTTMPPIPKHFVPSSHLEGNECVGLLCRHVANMLRSKIATYIDPCVDFYQYVCGTFRGWSTFKDTADLVRWMAAMDLDFLNTTRLESIDPVDIMVRGALDFGVEAIMSITTKDREFDKATRERILEINYSKEQETWLMHATYKGRRTIEDDYSQLFVMYELQQGQASALAEKVYAYEERLRSIEKSTVNWNEWRLAYIEGMGYYTYPHVTGAQWLALFSKYTAGIYKSEETPRLFPHSLRIVKKLYDDTRVGKVGLQYLVAWSIYRQLVNFTDPHLFRGDRNADEYCFEHVKKVMRLAIVSHYFQSCTYISCTFHEAAVITPKVC
ncbi:hypothetical protein MTO96_029128 [Rhipicephalus appendiculatus]